MLQKPAATGVFRQPHRPYFPSGTRAHSKLKLPAVRDILADLEQAREEFEQFRYAEDDDPVTYALPPASKAIPPAAPLGWKNE